MSLPNLPRGRNRLWSTGLSVRHGIKIPRSVKVIIPLSRQSAVICALYAPQSPYRVRYGTRKTGYGSAPNYCNPRKA